jgi:hypothetical protein
LVDSDAARALEVLSRFGWIGEEHRSLAVAAHSGQLFQREMNEPRAQASGAFVFASTSLGVSALQTEVSATSLRTPEVAHNSEHRQELG